MKNNQILKVCQKCKAECCKMGGPDVNKIERNRILQEGFKNYFVKIKKTLSLPHLKRCGLFRFLGCSEKSDSCKATICNLKVAVYFSDINNNHYELKSMRGLCPYLEKDNSCNIHNTRPLMCKCWPVYIKYFGEKRIFILVKCPLTHLLSKKDVKIMKKQASKIPREIIGDTFSNSRLSKSDLILIKKRFNRFKKKNLK